MALDRHPHTRLKWENHYMANIRNNRHLHAGKPTMHRKSVNLFDYRKIEGIANDCYESSTKTALASAILATFLAEGQEMQRNKPVRYQPGDRKSPRLNSSHLGISYAVFC